jgi:hypothetical protein
LLTPQEIAKAQSVPEHLIANTVATLAYQGLGQGVDYRQGLGIGLILARDVFSKITNEVVKPLGKVCQMIESSVQCVELLRHKKTINDDVQIALF